MLRLVARVSPLAALRFAALSLAAIVGACGAPEREQPTPAHAVDVAAAALAPALDVPADVVPGSSATLWGETKTWVKETRADGRLLVERAGGVMGSSMRLSAVGTDQALLERALIAAEAELRRVEDLCTEWRPSPLTEVNLAAGTGAVPVDRELAEVVQRALLVAQLTGGAFDPTWRGVGKLWNLRADPPVVPDESAILAALPFVGYAHVVVDVESQPATVTLPAGFELGLGGIAQGYGADRAMAVLVEHGVEHAIVDVSGDLKLLGRHFDEPWEIAISHPRRRGEVMAVLRVSNTCIVTSGDYERFAEIDGQRYHHIIDPHTGRPSTGCMSATVVGPDATVCDGLATALCVMGPDQGLALIESSGAYQAICVGVDGNVRATEGLRASVRPNR
jgi:thiamine biosynthesis lipoprotein